MLENAFPRLPLPNTPSFSYHLGLLFDSLDGLDEVREKEIEYGLSACIKLAGARATRRRSCPELRILPFSIILASDQNRHGKEEWKGWSPIRLTSLIMTLHWIRRLILSEFFSTLTPLPISLLSISKAFS